MEIYSFKVNLLILEEISRGEDIHVGRHWFLSPAVGL